MISNESQSTNATHSRKVKHLKFLLSKEIFWCSYQKRTRTAMMKYSSQKYDCLISGNTSNRKKIRLIRICSKNSFLLSNNIMMKESKRTYTRIDEFTFKVEQDRHLEEEMKIDQKMNYLAQCLNWLRECVKWANEFQDKFVKIVETYNRYVDMLEEAKKECWYDFKLPKKIDLPDCFDIIEVKIENIPTVEFKMNENK